MRPDSVCLRGLKNAGHKHERLLLNITNGLEARIGSRPCLSQGTEKDASYRRGCLSSNKRKSPERVSAPGPACLRELKKMTVIDAGVSAQIKKARSAYRLQAQPGTDVHNGFDYKVLKYRQKYTLSAICTLVNWSVSS